MQLKKSFYHEVKDRLPEHVLEYWGGTPPLSFRTE